MEWRSCTPCTRSARARRYAQFIIVRIGERTPTASMPVTHVDPLGSRPEHTFRTCEYSKTQRTVLTIVPIHVVLQS